MANIKSKIKRHLQDEKKRILSHSKNSALRTSIKKSNETDDLTQLNETISLLDKGVKAKRIHHNKANRLKSRLTIKANKIK